MAVLILYHCGNILACPDKDVKSRGENYFRLPERLTINLAPAGVHKAGPNFDLPIAEGILAATGQVFGDFLEDALVTGELSLDGSVRPITSALAHVASILDVLWAY